MPKTQSQHIYSLYVHQEHKQQPKKQIENAELRAYVG